MNDDVKKKKKVRFSNFNQIFIIPNRIQLKLLEYDPFAEKNFKEKKGKFTITKIEDDSEKT